MQSFPEEVMSIDSKEKNIVKRLCVASYCYSITKDK